MPAAAPIPHPAPPPGYALGWFDVDDADGWRLTAYAVGPAGELLVAVWEGERPGEWSSWRPTAGDGRRELVG